MTTSVDDDPFLALPFTPRPRKDNTDMPTTPTPPPLDLATISDRTWRSTVGYINQLDLIVATATALIGTDEATAARQSSKALVNLGKARARNAGLIVAKRLVEQVCALTAPEHSGDGPLVDALIADFHVSVGRVEATLIKGSNLPLNPTLRTELTEAGILAARSPKHPEPTY